VIDIHCHLLPGIDDGSPDLAQSLAMARMAVADGITRAVLTPHIQPGRWDNSAQGIAAATNALRAALAREGIALELGFAAEVRLSDQIFRQLEEGLIPFLGDSEGSKVMLLEFPHSHILPGTDKLVAWLLRNGIRPLIAHPERNREIIQDPRKLAPFIDQGCLAQLTGASLTGRFGEGARQAAEYFLREGQVSYLASDAHNTSTRPPAMAEARRIIARLVGEETAEALAFGNPRQLVAHQFASSDHVDAVAGH
jgi:protein-tyrosine phosphatase